MHTLQIGLVVAEEDVTEDAGVLEGTETSWESGTALECLEVRFAVGVSVVVALTFCVGFGNVLALGLRLGVPMRVAPPLPVKMVRDRRCLSTSDEGG